MGREISNKDFQISENLPNSFLKAEQFFTFADLVSDGAETEGFATPSRNSIPIPSSLIHPTSENNQLLQTPDEILYIQLAQRDIFLDGRAIRDLAGAENITKTSMAIRVGKDNQPIMSGINEFKSSGNLSPAKVLNNNDAEGNKVTGTVDVGTGINDTPRAVIVTLTWQSLRQLGADDGASVALGIQPNSTFPNGLSGNVDIVIRLRGNNNQEIGRRTIEVNGVSVGQYSADYRVDIPDFAFLTQAARNLYYPISVDVLRTDLEFREVGGKHPFSDKGRNLYEEGSRRFTEFFFTKLQAVNPQITTITEFPKSAYIGIRYSAEQFPNIPQRKYLYRGIKVKVPSGITIDVAGTGRIVYPSGYNFAALDSTKKWTNDPAWILYALLTEDYGLNLDESSIDKASFYEASLYCSTFVGNTGLPRYSFNGVINVRKKAIDVIREVAGLMRATIFYKNGNLKIVLDKQETITSYLFTNANVVDGQFNYVGSDKDKKYSQINVAYYNNDLQEMDQVTVLDTTVETKYGINQQNVRALFTTDKNQAVRFGRSILYSSNFESEVVSFECGIEAACKLEPLMVIKIADRLKEAIRASGRIKSVTSATVYVLDDSTNTSVGFVNDTFLIIDTSGNVQERTISAVNGSTVTLSSALNANAGTVWAVKTGNVQHRKFRISNIKQKNDFVFSITALTYTDEKFSYIDGNIGSFGVGESPSTLLDVIDPPNIYELKEETIVVNNRATSRIVLNFGHVAGAKQYQVAYRLEEGDPVVQNVTDNEFVIPNNVAGLYKFSIRSINSAFQVSKEVNAQNIQALGLSADPSNVSNLRFEESGDDLILKWDKADPLTDIDVLFGGQVIIQFAAITDGSAEYGNSSPLRAISGDSNEITITSFLSGEYFVKFKDVAGNESSSATSVVVNRLVTSPNLKAQEIRESTSNFAGAKSSLEYDSSIAGLTLTSAISLDNISDFDTLAHSGGNFATLDLVTGGTGAGIPDSGNYTFENTIDLGAVFRFRVETVEKKQGYNTVTQWDSYTDKMDTWPDIFTGSTVQFDKTADLTFQVAKSSTATPSTSFATFTNTDMTTRTIAFKVLVNNDSAYENVDIEELGVNIIFRPRTERSIDNTSATNGILSSSSSGATTVTFAKKFFLGTSAVGGGTEKFKPVIAININNMQSGDFFTIDSVSTSNFVVSIKNGSSFVARQFTYSAFGYGEG